MKKQSACQSAFSNSRVLISFAFCSIGVLLALVAFALYPGGNVIAAPRPQQNQSSESPLARKSPTLLDGTGTVEPLSVPPTLGNYPDAAVALSGNRTVTPDATPFATTRITVSTSTNFKGTFAASPATGIVTVTDAHPAGTYTVAVTAVGPDTTTKTFTLTVVTTPCGAGFTAGFTNTAAVNVGSNPQSVAIGDFNGDGKQDLAVANVHSDTVSIRLGNGSGGFSGSTNVSVGLGPVSVAIGDFNGDGKQDFATANFLSSMVSGTVSIRFGDGSGGFTGSTEISVGGSPFSVAIGDFNGDRKQDFAVANLDSSTVSIRLGDGLGGFTGSTNVSVDAHPVSLAIGDFDGNGKQDFAVGTDLGVSIRLGDGMGGFSGSTNISVAFHPTAVTVGDFNGDGKQDLAFANPGGTGVLIRLGDGLGGFSGSTNIVVGSQPSSIAIGDYNGDGKLDLAVSNYESHSVSIRLGNGVGGFTGSTNVTVGSNPYSVAAGDFNGDGRQDLAVANYFSDTVSILRGDCVSAPTPAFVKAININGNTATINGNNWLSYASALATGFTTSFPTSTYSTNIAFTPPVDAPTNGMLNTGIWCPTCDVNFNQTLANGNYDIYLWAVENYQANYRSYDVNLEGVPVALAIGSLALNTWQRYGPYSVTVSDGALDVNLARITGDPLVQGIEIWSTDAPPQTFVKAININGNMETINGNSWTSYATALTSGFATSNPTYSTSIAYSPAVDAPTNRMLNTGIWCPACDVNFSQTISNGNYVVYLWGVENYQANYRSYNVNLEGVQVASAIGILPLNTWQRYGPYNVTVSDGTLNVNLARVTGDPLVQGVEIWSPTSPPTATPTPTPSPSPTFIKGININGNVETINGNQWTDYSSALLGGFATSNPTYSTNISFSPAADAPTNRMLNTGIWCPACDVNFSQNISNGNYLVYLWAVENYQPNYRSYNVKLEGVQVAAGIGSLPLNGWQRYGPYSVTLSDGNLNVTLVRVTGDPLVQGVEIWNAGF